jgi:hypothetical protein
VSWGSFAARLRKKDPKELSHKATMGDVSYDHDKKALASRGKPLGARAFFVFWERARPKEKGEPEVLPGPWLGIGSSKKKTPKASKGGFRRE